jgi:hypothetical protein
MPLLQRRENAAAWKDPQRFGATAEPTFLCSCLIDFKSKHLKTAGVVRPNS